MTRKRLTVADFFCGAGGWSEGFRQMGFEMRFALDHWQPAVDTHELNHPDCETVRMDILELDTPERIDAVVPDTDIIVGSPPCVSFSHSNNAGKADKSLGVRLIESYLRIVLWKKSKGVLKHWCMENVPNSAKYTKDRYTWKELGLPGKGPDLEVPVREFLVAADFGTPQTRRRFVCGDYPVPERTHDEESWVTMRHVLRSLGEPLGKRPRTAKDPVFGFSLPAKRLTDHYYDTRVAPFEWEKARRQKEDHGYMGRMSFPENLDRPSRTVMATRSASTREAIILGAGTDEDGDPVYRLPTIREVACYMSFPITYQFQADSESNKYRLVGNAVCVGMSRAIAAAMLDAEGRPRPEGFIAQDIEPPGTDLTGLRKEIKEPSPRRADARFKRHVPYLKVRSFRVELTNEPSDFDKDSIVWDAVLHYGSGKSAEAVSIPLQYAMALAKQLPQFPAFRSAFSDIVEQLPDAEGFQDLFTQRLRGERLLSPSEALEEVRRLVDEHLPEDRFGDVELRIPPSFRLSRGRIPGRIAFALFAVRSIADKVNGKASRSATAPQQAAVLSD